MKKILAMLLLVVFISGCSSSEYTVQFNTEGGSVIESQPVLKNKQVIKPTDPIKEGYSFLYWEVSGKEYDFKTKIKDNIILNAKWEEDNVKKYKVSYKIDDNEKTEEYQAGIAVKEPDIPQKNGYQFIGWYINEDLYDFDKILNSDITLIAKFKKTDDNSSTSPSNETYFVTDLDVSVPSNELKVKDKMQIEYKIGPENATNKTLSFSTSNKRIVEVSDQGELKGVRVGTATITIKTTDDSNIVKTIVITVVK